MRYEVKPDGTIVVGSLEEAIELSRMLQSNGVPRKQKSKESNSETDPVGKRAFQALEILGRSGDMGIRASKLAKELGLENPKGLAGVAKAIRHRIEEKALGRYKVTDIFWRIKIGGQPSRWFVNPDLLAAVGLVQISNIKEPHPDH